MKQPPACQLVQQQSLFVLPGGKKKERIFFFFLLCPIFSKSRAHAQAVACQDKESIKVKLRIYLHTTEMNSDADPVKWWKCYKVNFIQVTKLSKWYPCLPATSSPSVKSFRTGRNIITSHRAALKPNAVDGLVFLALNL